MYTSTQKIFYSNYIKHICKCYFQICKTKVVILMLISAFLGMIFTPKSSHNLTTATCGLVGIGLSACAGAAFNHLFEAHSDKKMARTANRPLPSDKITQKNVKYFAIASLTTSTLILLLGTNILACSLTLLTCFSYGLVYTKWLKPNTPQNIVIGGLSGAMPPLLGWTCLHPIISAEPIILVLIIFAWTPAHFWPLAIAKHKEYIQSNLPMLPNTHGIKFTKIAIIAYAYLTLAASILPFCIKMSSINYLITASILNCRWIWVCTQLWKDTTKAMYVFKFSIQYILIIFMLLIIDHLYHPNMFFYGH